VISGTINKIKEPIKNSVNNLKQQLQKNIIDQVVDQFPKSKDYEQMAAQLNQPSGLLCSAG